MLTRREFQGIDRPLLMASLALLAIGLLTLYSASFQKAQALGVSFISRQFMWAGLGILVAVLLIVVDYHRWIEWAYLLYGLNLILLFLVLELGVVRGGAQRWLSLGGFTIQPSEFSKITTILVLARHLGCRRDAGFSSWATIARAAAFVVPPMLLILKEPNLGTATVFLPVTFAMLVVAGVRWRVLLTLAALFLFVVPFAWSYLEEYQRSRLMVFMNPNLDPLGAGYTIIQSKIAIGSGSLFGKGWLAGTQNQLNFLPERHTDFVFSVVGEEWGFLGTSVCLALFSLLFYRGILLATQTRDPMGRLLLAGLVTLLASHVIVNTGMCLGLMPVVGLPLPFMSYGGSWLLTCLVAVGIALSVGARRPVFF